MDKDQDIIQMDEMLQSMAESLMERQAFYTGILMMSEHAIKVLMSINYALCYFIEKSIVPQKEDIIPPQSETIKPDADILYRRNPLYLKKAPNDIAQRRCSCQYLCTGMIIILVLFVTATSFVIIMRPRLFIYRCFGNNKVYELRFDGCERCWVLLSSM